jgi:hypothetical protein
VYITTEEANDVDVVTLQPMMLLEETREHLTVTEFSSHEAFESLQLYQTIRSAPTTISPTAAEAGDTSGGGGTGGGGTIFANGTQVAFGGLATFAQLAMSSQEMLEVQYLSFLGDNETVYVDRLRRMGWSSLQRALLMTATGGMIRFDNGTLTMMTATGDEESRIMEKGTSNLIVSLATMIPVAILSLAVFLFAGYAFRTKMHWKLPSSNDSAWRYTTKPRTRPPPTTTASNYDNSALASGGSVVVNIHNDNTTHEPTIHPALLRLQEKAARARDKV